MWSESSNANLLLVLYITVLDIISLHVIELKLTHEHISIQSKGKYGVTMYAGVYTTRLDGLGSTEHESQLIMQT